MVETLITRADRGLAGIQPIAKPPVVDEAHPYMQALKKAEENREERIRLGDIAASLRPPLPGITDGA